MFVRVSSQAVVLQELSPDDIQLFYSCHSALVAYGSSSVAVRTTLSESREQQNRNLVSPCSRGG
jgi:hypothetical protein